jgi:hypothetical protein
MALSDYFDPSSVSGGMDVSSYWNSPGSFSNFNPFENKDTSSTDTSSFWNPSQDQNQNVLSNWSDATTFAKDYAKNLQQENTPSSFNTPSNQTQSPNFWSTAGKDVGSGVTKYADYLAQNFGKQAAQQADSVGKSGSVTLNPQQGFTQSQLAPGLTQLNNPDYRGTLAGVQGGPGFLDTPAGKALLGVGTAALGAFAGPALGALGASLGGGAGAGAAGAAAGSAAFGAGGAAFNPATFAMGSLI